MKVFRYRKSLVPTVVCVPHAGTFIPPEYANAMTSAGLATRHNWFLMEKLEQCSDPEIERMGLIASNVARHVVDLDCDPDLPDVCPTKCLDGKAIYHEGNNPTKDNVATRVEHYWKPFHQQLTDELERLVKLFGKFTVVVLKSIDFTDTSSFISKSIQTRNDIHVIEIFVKQSDRVEQFESILLSKISEG